MMGRLRCNPRLAKLPLLLLAVERHLLLQFAVELFLAKQHSCLFEEASDRVHGTPPMRPASHVRWPLSSLRIANAPTPVVSAQPPSECSTAPAGWSPSISTPPSPSSATATAAAPDTASLPQQSTLRPKRV